MAYDIKCILIVIILIFVLLNAFLMYLHEDGRKETSLAKDAQTLQKLNKTLGQLLGDLHSIHTENNRLSNVFKLSEKLSSNTNTTEIPLPTANPIPIVETVQNELFHLELLDKPPTKKIRALFYTMDSMSQYEQNSKKGGAAGELTIRRSLEVVFRELGVDVTTLRSDMEFERCDLSLYHIVIVDPWTWAAKGWVLKSHLHAHVSKIFVLDFFGAKNMRNSGIPGLKKERILTAFGSQWNNTYLGYFIDENTHAAMTTRPLQKKRQGVVWGKDAKHIQGNEKILENLARDTELGVTLLSTASDKKVLQPPVVLTGHLQADKWIELLFESRFLIGLGNPILGPSAVDAISMGCMFINPVYEVRGKKQCKKSTNGNCYDSQHPFATEQIGIPYVCIYRERNLADLKHCVQLSLNTTLRPVIPHMLRKEEYVARVRRIFSL